MKIDFVGKRKWFYAISLIIIIAGLVATFTKGFVQDIEFIGGTIIEIELGKEFNNSEVEEIVTRLSGETPRIQKMRNAVTGIETKVSISTTALEEDVKNQIIDEIYQKYEIAEETDAATFRTVKPTFGDEMKSRVWKAVIITAIGIAIYIAIVFKSMSGALAGVSAVTALIHDMLIVFAVYAIFGIPLNTTFVAAILTVLGYSINDTVVIFDRIRENTISTRKGNLEEVVNTSINQSLRRTLFTSVCVIAALVLLYGFAVYYKVSSIQEFALPLGVGLIAGTYSSICLSGNILITLNKLVAKVKNK